MITVESRPPLVVLADDPVVLKFSSDNIIETAGVQASIRLFFTGLGLTGESFSVGWGLASILFNIVDNPDESLFQIKSGSGMILADWVQYYVLPVLSHNYYISSNYNLLHVAGQSDIYLQAIPDGSEYNISTSVMMNGKAGIHTMTQGVNESERENFGILLETFLISSANKINTDKLDKSSDGKFYTNLSEIISPYLASGINHPQQRDKQILHYRDFCRKFYYRYAETYANAVRKLSDLDYFYAIPGGSSWMDTARLNAAGETFFSRLAYTQQFLTWSPRVKSIFTDQPESLHYLNITGAAVINRMVSVTFTDLSEQTFTLPAVSIYSAGLYVATYQQYNVYEFVTNYDILGIAALNPSKTPLRYEFYLTNIHGRKISESKYYDIDRRILPNKRMFRFINSLSGWDTVCFTGESVKSADIERIVYEVQLPYTFTDRFKQIADFSAMEKQTFKTNTGFMLSKDDADYFRQLLLSKEIYEVVDSNLFPVVLISGKIDLYSDSDDLYSCEIEYTRAYTDKHYSRENSELYARFNQSFNNSFQRRSP